MFPQWVIHWPASAVTGWQPEPQVMVWRSMKAWPSIIKAWHIMTKNDGMAQHNKSMAHHDEA
jgi:hypothetical protein